MHTEDSIEFGKLMTLLGEVYGKSVGKFLHELYWRALEKYNIEHVQEAFYRHIGNPDTGQFMPKPADIVRLLEGNTGTQAQEAWSKVEKTIRLVGPYQSVVFDDARIHAVIEALGGWIQLCCATYKSIVWVQREFEQRYRTYALSPPIQYPAKLIGIAEHENSVNRQKIAPPLLIGDYSEAQKVLETGHSQNHLPIQIFHSVKALTQERRHESEDRNTSFKENRDPTQSAPKNADAR